jgi:hypothetical protein
LDDLAKVMDEYRAHGVCVEQVIIAQPWEDLSQGSRTHIELLERKVGIDVVRFDRQIGLGSAFPEAQDTRKQFSSYVSIEGFYPSFKRVCDIFGALLLLIITSPLMMLTACLVAIDIGFPLIFWQWRPGVMGSLLNSINFVPCGPCGIGGMKVGRCINRAIIRVAP